MDDAGFAILDSQSSILVSRRGRIVRQLHYIIEISSRVIPPHVQDIHLAGVSAGDRLYLAAAVPTLIIWGDHDRIIPVAQGRAAHEAIPGSRLEIFEGTGHFPQCERPDEFARLLTDFMDATQPSTTSASEWRDRLLARST